MARHQLFLFSVPCIAGARRGHGDADSAPLPLRSKYPSTATLYTILRAISSRTNTCKVRAVKMHLCIFIAEPQRIALCASPSARKFPMIGEVCRLNLSAKLALRMVTTPYATPRSLSWPTTARAAASRRRACARTTSEATGTRTT